VQASSWYTLTPVRRAGVQYFHLEVFLYAFDPAGPTLLVPQNLKVLVSWRDGPTERQRYNAPRQGPTRILSVKMTGPELVEFLVEGGFDIAGRKGDEIKVYASSAEMERLRDAGFEFRVLPDTAIEKARALRRNKGVAGLGSYHSHEAVGELLEGLVDRYPDLCRLESIGQSVQGREILALKISDNPDVDEDEPEIKLASTLHGDEPPGTELCLYFADHLLSEYGQDARVARIVDDLEVWILPLLNPDGLTAGTRYNARSVDLNRAFPDRIQDPVNSPEGREPEVAAMMAFSADREFALGANFHTGALVVNYPWDSNESGRFVDTPTPDDALFEWISTRYAQHNPGMLASTEFPGGISNGAEWYVIYGGMQDWSYEWNATLEVTVELSDVSWPSASALPELWDDNRESLLAYVESAFTAVSGGVTDAATGEVVSRAQVQVTGTGRPLLVRPASGAFHRMLVPGTYELTFRAPGYDPLTVSGIVVTEGSITPLDVELLPAVAPAQEGVLVVAHDSLDDGATAMADYYDGVGYGARLLTFAGSPDADAIRELIRTEYDRDAFEYLLLVGDTDTLATFQRSEHVSDLLYSLLDSEETWSDFLGRDVAMGRLPLRSDAEIMTYRDKLGRFHAARRDQRFLWLSQGNNDSECGVAEGTHAWVRDNLAPPGTYHGWFPCSSGTAAEMCDELNERIDVLTYSGHGGTHSWMRWNLSEGDLSCLQNETDPPVVFSHACLTGSFGETRCWGESWVFTSERGVVFVGASNNTYWDEDDWLEKEEFTHLLAEEPVALGPSLLRGLDYVAGRSGRGAYYHEIYHIFGDPTVRLAGGLSIVDIAWADGGNGIAEPGESGDLTLAVVNQMEIPVNGLQVGIATTSGEVTLPEAPIVVGDLGRGASAVVTCPATVDAACPAGRVVPLEFTLAYEEGAATRPGSLTVHEIDRVAGRVVFDEDGTAAAGVRVELVGSSLPVQETGADGRFEVSTIEGTYTLRASLDGYFREELALTLPGDHDAVELSLGWAEAELSRDEVRLVCTPDAVREVELSIANPGTRPLEFHASFSGGGQGGSCPASWAYAVCDEPDDPTTAWESMDGAVTLHSGRADDAAWGPVELPFSWPFYGQEWSEVYAGSNGYLTLSGPSTQYSNQSLPAMEGPPALIAAVWDDLVVNGAVLHRSDADHIVFEFRDVSHYSGSSSFSFQIALYADSSIVYRYQDVPWSSLTPTVGVQDSTRARGLTVAAAELTDDAVRLCSQEDEEAGEVSCPANYVVTPQGEPGGPDLDWVNTDDATVAHSGTADDAVWGPFPLPFAFPFYGEESREIYISSNGFLTFVAPGGSFYTNSVLPSADAPGWMVAALWDDLVVPSDGSIRLLEEADRYVVEYRDVEHYGGSAAFSIQIILHASGETVVQYQGLPLADLSPTVGVQDGSGAVGITAPASALESGALLISSRPSWIDMEPREGIVPPGETMPLTVTLTCPGDAEEIATTIVLRTDSPRLGVIELPVELTGGDEEGFHILRGDVEVNGELNLSDAIASLQYQFTGGQVDCLAAVDANGDAGIDISDPVYVLLFLFAGGAAPPPPFPECGPAGGSTGNMPCDIEHCP